MFTWLGWYLNFSTWFVKNMSIIWTEKDKIVKYTEIMHYVLKIQ